MGDISPHFSRHEFACECLCGLDTVDAETILVAEFVREINSGPITPTSGCRCGTHNILIGGSKISQHVKCRAVDLPVKNPIEVYNALCREYPNKYGFGVYDTFVHIDTRSGNPARWSNIGKSRHLRRGKIMSFLKGYRTVIVSVLLGSLTVAHGFGVGAEITPDDVTSAVDKVEVAIGAVWSIAAVVMRSITTTPIGKS